MAIVERPLAAVIAAPRIASPRSSRARPSGITGVPSDTAVLDSIVAGAGGDPRRVQTITIGFNAVADLLAGRVAGRDRVLERRGRDAPAPPPGLSRLPRRRLRRAAVPGAGRCARPRATPARATPGSPGTSCERSSRGYGFTLAPPAHAARPTSSGRPGLDPSLVSAELTALLPAFPAPAGAFGELDPATLRRWARGRRGSGSSAGRPTSATMFDPSFADVRSAAGQASSRATSAAPSRAIRERGTTRSKPAASARLADVGLDVRVERERRHAGRAKPARLLRSARRRSAVRSTTSTLRAGQLALERGRRRPAPPRGRRR